MSFKFRVGIMDWPWFSKYDNVSFHIMMKEKGFMQIPTDFIEAETAEEAKAKLHAIVDKIFEHKAHMERLERLCAENKVRHQQLVADAKECNSLTIGDMPPPPPPSSMDVVLLKDGELSARKSPAQSDLLDLCGDVLEKDAARKNDA